MSTDPAYSLHRYQAAYNLPSLDVQRSPIQSSSPLSRPSQLRPNGREGIQSDAASLATPQRTVVASSSSTSASPHTPAAPPTTPVRSGASTYFDTYTPYKLNPALIPSTRKNGVRSKAKRPDGAGEADPCPVESLAVPKGLPSAPTQSTQHRESLTHGRHPFNGESASGSALLSPPPSKSPSLSPGITRLDAESLAQAGLDREATKKIKAQSVEAWRSTALKVAETPRRPRGPDTGTAKGYEERPKEPTPVAAAEPEPELYWRQHSSSSARPPSPTFLSSLNGYDSDSGDSFLDSATREARKVLQSLPNNSAHSAKSRVSSRHPWSAERSTRPRLIHHAISYPNGMLPQQIALPPPLPARSVEALPPPIFAERLTNQDERSRITMTSSSAGEPNGSLISSLSSLAIGQNAGVAYDPVQAFVRSSRLTRILTLGNPPHTDLKVSLADVGDPDGHPVFVFLGLGAIRYLVGLYDELAKAMGLRLICVDRWGLGKTDDVSNERRGLLEWGSVITEVANQLGIERFSVLAHSAGAPFAMATVLLQTERIVGPVHLLAPWVSVDLESGYKWLRYVPEQVIRTAQAAEWKLTGWKLGRGLAEEKIERLSTPPESTSIDSSRLSLSISKSLRPFDTGHQTCSFLAEAGARSPQVLPVALSSPSGKAPIRSPVTPIKTKPSFLGSIFTPKGDQAVASGPEEDALETEVSQNGDYFAIPRSSLTISTTTKSDPLRLTPTRPSHKRHTEQNAQSIHIIASDLDFPASFLPTRDTGLCGPLNSPNEDTGGKYGSCSSHGSITSPARRRVESGGSALLSGVHKQTPMRSGSMGILPTAASPSRPTHRLSEDSIPTALAPKADLATCLLRASHAESLRGSTADLMTILGGHSTTHGSSKKAKPWGFTFADVRHPIRAWQGDKDERIGLGSALWMERECLDCTLTVVKGAGHGLMTNSKVVLEALESLATYKNS